MSHSHQSALFAALHRLLRPLVRILLRNGVPFAAFADMAKCVYVEVAGEDFGIPGKRQTNSRISTITGLTRKEVLRISNLDEYASHERVEKHHRAARVVSGWVRDEEYHTRKGEPAPLPLDGKASFSALVKTYSGDVPPRAILDELIQVGVVALDSEGRAQLLERAYIPNSGHAEKLGILGQDVAGLIDTIDHNIQSKPAERFFQRKVFYDNMPDQAIPELRALLDERGQPLLEEFDRWMAKHDRDTNPKVKGDGRNAAGIGIYYFEERIDDEKPS